MEIDEKALAAAAVLVEPGLFGDDPVAQGIAASPYKVEYTQQKRLAEGRAWIAAYLAQ